MPRQLTASFTLDELVSSQTATRKGLDNTPGPSVLATIEQVLAPGLQRIRDALGVPVLVSSGYRAPAVNSAVGGSRTSQHCTGNAADFTAPAFGSPLDVCRRLVELRERIGYDQLIYEGTWVHVSFVRGTPRGQVLTAHFGKGGVTYSPGLA